MKRIALILLLLCGCHRASYERGEGLGADEFVMDSYALREEVPAESAGFVSVAGAVMKRGVVPVLGKHRPLRDVLLDAGGIKTLADRNKIYVFRGGQDRPRVYALTWEHLVRLPKTSLLTTSGDIVFIGTKPLFEWFEHE